MLNTTLCYIERDGAYLMLHRIKKQNDMNKDKWLGVGGKLEAGESPHECATREIFEETGVVASGLRYRVMSLVSTSLFRAALFIMMPFFAPLKWSLARTL